jgi:hypothetical protein
MPERRRLRAPGASHHTPRRRPRLARRVVLEEQRAAEGVDARVPSNLLVELLPSPPSDESDTHHGGAQQQESGGFRHRRQVAV